MRRFFAGLLLALSLLLASSAQAQFFPWPAISKVAGGGGGGGGSFSWIQAATETSVATTGTIATLSATTQYDLIVCNIKANNSITALTLADNIGNTYASVGVHTTTEWMYYGVDVTGGVTSVTATYSGGSNIRTQCLTFRGSAQHTNAAILDTASTSTGTSTGGSPMSYGTPFTPTTGELIVVSYGGTTGGTGTAGTNYTMKVTTSNNLYVEYRLVGTNSETAPLTINNSVAYQSVIGAFKP